jgi:hypothetical protein
MPTVDKLNPKKAGIQIFVAKHIGAVTGAYGEVVRRVEIQGKAKIPDVEFIPHLGTVDL